MKLSEITENDAKMAASLGQILAVSEKLFDALKLAGLPVTGPGFQYRAEAAKWFGDICRQMAVDLKEAKPGAVAPKPEDQTMRVKSIKPLSGAPSSSSPKPPKVKKKK